MRCISVTFYSLYSSSTWPKPKDLCSIWSFLKKRRFFYVQNAQISNSCQSDGSRPISSSSKNLMVSADKMASSPSYCKTFAKAAVIHESSKDVISSNKMIAKFIRSGNLNSACQVFDEMPYKTIVSWNTMLSGYCKLGKLRDAFELFDKMPQRDLFSFNIMLACYLQNSELEKAHEFFNNAPMKNVISWNVMISGLCQVGRMCEAHRLFLMMPEKNAASWGAMISGYAQNGYLDVAFELFRRNPLKNVVSWTAMITGFMKQGKFEIARNWFDQVPVRNSVTWNAMISGYIENCRAEDGLKLFRTMISKGVMPNPSCFSSILLGCSELSSLELGQQIHQHICKSPLRFNTTVGTSLLSMYYKCGDLDMSRKVFDEMPNRDIVTWNAMISGYAHHGDGEEAVKLFNEMHMTGIKPNWITFVSILMACNHSGLVDLGTQYFNSLKDSDIEVKPEHYSCMVDLLGRAGKLSEAVRLIESMPFKPHSSIFGTLLGACRAHKNLQLAEVAAKKLLESQPSYSIGYVQLANIYAQMNRWEDVARIRQMMKDNNVTKTPGYSWIQLKNVVHEFRSGDNIHGLLDILTKLNELEKKMKLAGYEPNLDYALHDVTDEEKEFLLLHHSEKLAVAFGLINIPAVTPIRIFKNLRVCGDCHSAMKYISMTEGREIILRDTTRFHHFKQGNCSCGDYW